MVFVIFILLRKSCPDVEQMTWEGRNLHHLWAALEWGQDYMAGKGGSHPLSLPPPFPAADPSQ